VPLEEGKSKAAFSHNVAAERAAGKPVKQAVAIAYKQAGEDGPLLPSDRPGGLPSRDAVPTRLPATISIDDMRRGAKK
jgi:hypothetical protein